MHRELSREEHPFHGCQIRIFKQSDPRTGGAQEAKVTPLAVFLRGTLAKAGWPRVAPEFVHAMQWAKVLVENAGTGSEGRSGIKNGTD